MVGWHHQLNGHEYEQALGVGGGQGGLACGSPWGRKESDMTERQNWTLVNHLFWKTVSSSVMSDSLWPHGLQPTRFFCPWNSPGKNTGVGCHGLLQGIFLTQGLNLGLLHCRQRPLCLWATREAHLLIGRGPLITFPHETLGPVDPNVIPSSFCSWY